MQQPVQDPHVVWKRLIDVLFPNPDALKEVSRAPRKSS